MKKRFTSEFVPRFSDFDVQGILNSRTYVDLLVEARLDQMIHCYKLPMDHYAKKNQSWVFSSVTLNFVRPIFLGAKVTVETEVTSMEGSVAKVDFAFKCPTKGKIFADGSATYHLIDLVTKRPLDIPDSDREIFLSVQE